MTSSYFDAVRAIVRVRNGNFVGTGDVVFEEQADVPLGEHVSLDELYEVAPRFLYGELEVHDGYGVGVHAVATEQGGSGSSLQIVLELVEGLKMVTYAGLAALFCKFLMDELKSKDDDG